MRASDPATESSRENAGETNPAEADNDASQQAAACQAAGVDPSGANVQYDDQAGTCSAAAGGGGQTQQ